MEVEEKKIKTGKPYEELTKEEKALIVDFTEEEHAGMKLKYGNAEACHRTSGRG